MEKIFLKPESKEISIANHSKEIHSDVFSYDGGTDEPKRKLGSLFVVGSVQTAPGTIKENAAAIQSAEDKSSDVSYIINLVASLAKREYYSRANVAPKEAFSSALKKINDVVEEFFKTKDIKLNIGIFAVAGENIHISKLGKFKILLAREDRIIDILNNIDLFSKEIMPEREFSHIVSGKISPRDKIFAYYPAQPLMTREKTLKESLLKLDGEHFLNKLNDIKKARENFSCTAVYINLNEVKEPASLPKIKPREMEEKVILADASEQGDSRLAVRNTAAGAPPKENRDTVERAESPTSNRFAVSPSAEVLPQIIPAEFSLGKKINPAFVLMNKITNFFPRPRNKIVFFVSNIGLLLVALLAIKFFFITSPEEKAATKTLNDAKAALRLAQTQISQNDYLSARQLLAVSIVGLNGADLNSKATETKSRLSEILDGIDKASPASLTFVENPPVELTAALSMLETEITNVRSGTYGSLGEIKNANFYEDNLYVLTTTGIQKISDAGKNKEAKAVSWLKDGGQLPSEPRLIAVDGKVFVLNSSGLLTTYYKGEKTGELNTLVALEDKSRLLAPKDSKFIYLINQISGRIYFIDKNSGALEKTLIIGSAEPIENALTTGDGRLYIVTKDNKIWEVK
ncbi:MAG: hypothetical protein A2746_01685 [Candidatus Yanofskybacteria bacterium RIFCSPHIGHO2_01_FULL_44_22]|uniref:PPM-type phosphatase domain-containing protein n=1 Tax=Candidatus Yanofskybacteria bacterium RIFCSPHIGHO2_01_FULL_44_22 TaxID=1802669 RepID=A0A1F8ETD6_9BACT|nr:MAG: hypothetical protein A2746_01685 [Candidatus Yanofskybacteria bacterium RIFCSPHIGHO2_01_FULL_44_22]